MKKVELLFYHVNPSKTNTGMKHVLIEVTTEAGKVIHDWGFADWLGDKWDTIEAPEEMTCKVIWWANTLHPDVLVKDKSKIIKL